MTRQARVDTRIGHERWAWPQIPGVSRAELADSFEHCARVTASRGLNFSVGLRLTPEPRRSALYAIYAWMRRGDDEADAETDLELRRVRLAAFREATQRLAPGCVSPAQIGDDDPMWPALAATVRRYSIRSEWLGSMMDGLEDDLSVHVYETDEQLRRYCHRVASTVGLICTSIWGVRAGASPDDAFALAARTGQAFQLTNILRDYRQDYDAQPSRVYLSGESLARHGLTPAQVRRWSDPAACQRLVGEYVARARRDFEASAALQEMIEADCRPTLWAMTEVYRRILERIADQPRRIVAARRVRLPATEKARIAVAAIAMRNRRP